MEYQQCNKCNREATRATGLGHPRCNECYVKELESYLTATKMTADDLRSKIAALESELAPIRALKVGSWQWAMVRRGLGDDIRDKDGDRVSEECWLEWEPYHLHTEPPPAPTADEFCAAIHKAFPETNTPTWGPEIAELLRLAAAYRAANAKGVCPKCEGGGKADGGIGGNTRCRACRGSGKANAKGGA